MSTYELWGHINIQTIATHDPGSYLDNTETFHAPSYPYTVSTLLLLPGTPTLSSSPSKVSGGSSLVIIKDPIQPYLPCFTFLWPMSDHNYFFISAYCLPYIWVPLRKMLPRLSQIPWWSSQPIGHWVSYLVADMAGGELVITQCLPNNITLLSGPFGTLHGVALSSTCKWNQLSTVDTRTWS